MRFSAPGLVRADPGRRAAAPPPAPGAPVIRRTLTTAKEFSKLTDEGPLTREGPSQNAITPLWSRYHTSTVGGQLDPEMVRAMLLWAVGTFDEAVGILGLRSP